MNKYGYWSLKSRKNSNIFIPFCTSKLAKLYKPSWSDDCFRCINCIQGYNLDISIVKADRVPNLKAIKRFLHKKWDKDFCN